MIGAGVPSGWFSCHRVYLLESYMPLAWTRTASEGWYGQIRPDVSAQLHPFKLFAPAPYGLFSFEYVLSARASKATAKVSRNVLPIC